MAEAKRLTRSTANRVLAGVCGGLGEYFSVDPLIIRIVFIALVVWGGSGVLLYLVLWLVIPGAGDEQAPIEQRLSHAGNEMKEKAQAIAGGASSGRMVAIIVGTILILIGVSALGQIFFPWRIIRWDFFWPLLIILVGFLILRRRH